MTAGKSPARRYHAIDSLRTTMMTLGIVLHACMNYMTPAMFGGWLYRDRYQTKIADTLVAGIHTFRMPLFYILAGFFTALLVQRRGVPGMLKNRIARIMIPFLLFWVIIIPLALASALFANVTSFGGSGWNAIIEWSKGGHYWTDTTAHLWFLYFLSIFILLSAVATPILRRVPLSIQKAASRAFVWILSHPLRRLLLAIPIWGILWLDGGVMQTRMSFVPEPFILGGYIVYFIMGWALWHHQELLERLPSFAWTQTLLGTGMILWYVHLLPMLFAHRTAENLWLPVLLGGLIVWLMGFGLLGLAIHYASHEIPVMRYLTDASYWMYLVHVPLMFIIPGLLSRAELPALAKIAITLATGLPILVLSYHYLVRDTWIGRLLNGQRFPRKWPAL